MKKHLLALVALLPAVVGAADNFSSGFPQSKIELPPLSLAESARQTPPPWQDPAKSWSNEPIPTPSRAKKFLSVMPVIRPKEGVDYKLIIKAADPTVDYKMLINAPEEAGK
jgi:hypothetical protein